MNLAVEIFNVINISSTSLRFNDNERKGIDFQKIDVLLRTNDMKGYRCKVIEILMENLKHVIFKKEIAQSIKYFTLYNTRCKITKQNGITLNYCGHYPFVNAEAKEVLKLASRHCPNLEEVHLSLLDPDTLQILAESCVNLKTLIFGRCDMSIEIQLGHATPDILNLHRLELVNGALTYPVSCRDLTTGFYIKRLSMNDHSPLARLLQEIVLKCRRIEYDGVWQECISNNKFQRSELLTKV